MRLNGWQRIGIVASCLWALTGFAWGLQIGLEVGNYVLNAYERCTDLPNIPHDDCWTRYKPLYLDAISWRWLDAALMAFLPILAAWLLAWTVIRLTRWVRRGFQLP